MDPKKGTGGSPHPKNWGPRVAGLHLGHIAATRVWLPMIFPGQRSTLGTHKAAQPCGPSKRGAKWTPQGGSRRGETRSQHLQHLQHPERPQHLQHPERPQHLQHLQHPEGPQHLQHLARPQLTGRDPPEKGGWVLAGNETPGNETPNTRNETQ
jgi:hypothetical protein